MLAVNVTVAEAHTWYSPYTVSQELHLHPQSIPFSSLKLACLALTWLALSLLQLADSCVVSQKQASGLHHSVRRLKFLQLYHFVYTTNFQMRQKMLTRFLAGQVPLAQHDCWPLEISHLKPVLFWFKVLAVAVMRL